MEDLLSMLPHAERYRQEVERFSSVHRRLEWCAVRVLPLSISHTKGYVAVILGRPGEEVGIDIEQYGERVRKVSSRFMRTDEQAAYYKGTDTWGLLLHWSAKETLFKCMNSDGVDFCEHLRIFPFDVSSEGTFEAVEYRTAACRRFLVHYCLYTDFVLTYSYLPSIIVLE